MVYYICVLGDQNTVSLLVLGLKGRQVQSDKRECPTQINFLKSLKFAPKRIEHHTKHNYIHMCLQGLKWAYHLHKRLFYLHRHQMVCNCCDGIVVIEIIIYSESEKLDSSSESAWEPFKCLKHEAQKEKGEEGAKPSLLLHHSINGSWLMWQLLEACVKRCLTAPLRVCLWQHQKSDERPGWGAD